MDPLAFLDVARSLSGSAHESDTRTSVGRSYFAVFNHLRERLSPLKPFPGDPEDHQRVLHYLMGANSPALRSVGQTLNDLRASRKHADYDMNMVIDQQQSKLAVTRADSAVAKSQGVDAGHLKALIQAIPTYRSRRE